MNELPVVDTPFLLVVNDKSKKLNIELICRLAQMTDKVFLLLVSLKSAIDSCNNNYQTYQFD